VVNASDWEKTGAQVTDQRIVQGKYGGEDHHDNEYEEHSKGDLRAQWHP
jgi:hypothetical protein